MAAEGNGIAEKRSREITIPYLLAQFNGNKDGRLGKLLCTLETVGPLGPNAGFY